MNTVRIVSLDKLRRRLRDVLGDNALLRARFDRALASQDPDLVDAAMRALDAYPAHVRAAVEDAVLDWLFGGAAETPAELPPSRPRTATLH